VSSALDKPTEPLRWAAMTGSLRLVLLGGLEVWVGERQVRGFESQRVRALLAYLAAQANRSISRELLATLLWPEHDEESAKRNLRQAIYNLKGAFQKAGVPQGWLVADMRDVSLATSRRIWIDSLFFEEALRSGLVAGSAANAEKLAGAVEAYHGDFLEGFSLRDCAAFDDWQTSERERLRELYVQALRALTDHHFSLGETELGARYARLLLRADPLSEESHRKLMQLYAVSGRRGDALSQYEVLRKLLEEELGVEPLQETMALYEAIISNRLTPAATDLGEESNPILRLPTVGRDGDRRRLQSTWLRVLHGESCCTLVEGPPGVGKTHLVKALIDESTARRDALVVAGDAAALPTERPYGSLADALSGTLETALLEGNPALKALGGEKLRALAHLFPEIGHLLPGLRPTSVTLTRRKIALLFADVLLALTDAKKGPTRPLILFLDNVDQEPADVLGLLRDLLGALGGAPIWVILAANNRGPGSAPELRDWRDGKAPLGVDRVELGPLPETLHLTIAQAVVGAPQAQRLADHLSRRCQGHPLTLVHHLYSLRDGGGLARKQAGGFALSGPLPATASEGAGLDAELRDRIDALPASSKRLLSLCGILGPVFSKKLLTAIAEDERRVLVAILGVLVERWILRPYLRHWALSRWERDAEATLASSAGEVFEFVHPELWRAVRGQLREERRQAMHAKVLAALQHQMVLGEPVSVHLLAYHALEAADSDQALLYLRAAAQEAAAVGAMALAEICVARALDLCGKLAVRTGTAQALTIRKREREIHKWLAATRSAARSSKPSTPALARPAGARKRRSTSRRGAA
jgi:DNA-binding SARP family transcriptional activator